MTIGWIDFSVADQKQIESALNRLTPKGILDELGLGTIRDRLANQLFPGTSSLHTRTIYFLLVPQLLRSLAVKPKVKDAREFIQELYDREYQAMCALRDNCPDENGIIGKSAGRNLRQKPSGSYWSGIRQYGLVENYGSLYQFVKRCLPYWKKGNPSYGFAAISSLDHLGPEWKSGLSVELGSEDAGFLAMNIRRQHPRSLLADLLVLEEEEKDLVKGIPLAYQLYNLPRVRERHGRLLVYCRDYELICRSVLITYNEQLCEVRGEAPDWISIARDQLYEESAQFLHQNSLRQLLVEIPLDKATVHFLQASLGRLLKRKDGNADAKNAVRSREWRVKGSRARLDEDNRHLVEAMAVDKTPGIRVTEDGFGVAPVFDYRWPTTQNHLRDLKVFADA